MFDDNDLDRVDFLACLYGGQGVNKTMLERRCHKCGELYYFWLFGRIPCKCRQAELSKMQMWVKREK